MIGFVAAVAFTSCSKNDFVTTTQADIDKARKILNREEE